jgi:pyruvate kinase
MDRIAYRTEQALNYRELYETRSRDSETTITDAIGQAVTNTALKLKVSTIITATVSGHTAKVVSKYRPKALILAVTSTEEALRKLTLFWGVYPVLGKTAASTDEMLESAVDQALKSGFVHHGDLVVITAGVPVGEVGTTNLLKVHVVGEVLAKGQGIGKRSVCGAVYVTNNVEDANRNMPDGAILVTRATDKDMMPAVERASAIITEEGGLTSHGAVVSVSLDIPAIVGVREATSILKTGQEITVDAERGHIYNGHAKVL